MSRRRSVVRKLSAAEQTREDAECRLDELCAELGTEELEVLVRLAARLLHGQRAYGVLRLAVDRRDFEKERADELMDAIVYTGVLELQRVVRRRTSRGGT